MPVSTDEQVLEDEELSEAYRTKPLARFEQDLLDLIVRHGGSIINPDACNRIRIALLCYQIWSDQIWRH